MSSIKYNCQLAYYFVVQVTGIITVSHWATDSVGIDVLIMLLSMLLLWARE
jgi:hypothetical protein